MIYNYSSDQTEIAGRIDQHLRSALAVSNVPIAEAMLQLRHTGCVDLWIVWEKQKQW